MPIDSNVMIKQIIKWVKSREESRKLERWFLVSWDNEWIYRNVSPPGKEPWSDKFRWLDIERICYEATDPLYSDDVYFFTTERQEGYVVPIDATGGYEVWKLVLEKGLFDEKLAVEAATSSGGMFCWSQSKN